jgi:hypothetical protein
MKKLPESVQSLYEAVAAARALAEKHIGTKVGPLKIQANLLLLKIVAQCVAVLRSTPVSPLVDPNLPLWDLSTAASSTRSILESYLLFYYLFVEKVSTEERQFRFAVWLRHGLGENEKFRKISGTPAPTDWAQSISKAEDVLRKNPRFSDLDQNQQRNVLAGERSTMPKLEKLTPDILSRAGISKDLYGMAYRYCSSFVHTTFFTVEQLERIDASTGEGLAPFAMIAQITTVVLLLLIRDYARVFPHVASSISAELQNRIRDAEDFAQKDKSDWIKASQESTSTTDKT